MDPTLRAAGLDQASHILVACADHKACAQTVASLLRATPARVVCLTTQADAARSGLLASIAADWQRRSQGRWSTAVAQRLEFRQQPADLSELGALAAALAGVDALVHDAHSPAATAHWLLLARRLGVQRVVARCESEVAAREAERIAAACGVLVVVLRVAAVRRQVVQFARPVRPHQPQPTSTPAACAC